MGSLDPASLGSGYSTVNSGVADLGFCGAQSVIFGGPHQKVMYSINVLSVLLEKNPLVSARAQRVSERAQPHVCVAASPPFLTAA